MSHGQIEIYSKGSTHTIYETCGYDNCTEKVLKALGVGQERYSDSYVFGVTGEDGVKVTITVRGKLDEQDACTWCFGCGDFLQHGMSCGCKEWGFDPEEDREPMEPMVDVNGSLELRPY